MLSKFDLVQGLTLMTGQSALLFIQVRMPAEGIQEGITTVVFLVLNFARVPAEEVIHVNMHMESLSAGCTLHSIELGFAKMEQLATEEFAFLLTQQKNFGHCMSPLVLLYLLQGPVLIWICL